MSGFWMVPTIRKPDHLKSDLQNVRISNESGFWMVGFKIPTEIEFSKVQRDHKTLKRLPKPQILNLGGGGGPLGQIKNSSAMNNWMAKKLISSY